jgi:hypothetical protein
MAIDTVVLVHGAFADGSCWAKVIPLLTQRGLRAIAVGYHETTRRAGRHRDALVSERKENCSAQALRG